MKRASRIVVALFVFLLSVPPADTCAPSFPTVLVFNRDEPDEPRGSFLRGSVGIPLPTWWREYLVIAYRYLSDRPLSAAERTAYLTFCGRVCEGEAEQDPIEQWLNLRKRFRKDEPPGRESNRPSSDWSYYQNCFESAFRTASETLRERAQRFGGSTPELQEWIAGQDLVFWNCGRAEPKYPLRLMSSAPAWLRADRDYQIAASHFYARDFDGATAAFDAIAADSRSPWQKIAPYLSARALIRKATLDSEKPFVPEPLAEAETRLKAVLADRSRAGLHASAQGLLEFIAFRLHPDQRRHELAVSLADGTARDRFAQSLTDYTFFLDKLTAGQGTDFEQPENYRVQKEKWMQHVFRGSAHARADDLTDWVLTFQSDVAEATEHAVRKWQSTHSVPWLVAAIWKVPAGDPRTADLLAAAAGLKNDSLAYLAVTLQRARLLRESNRQTAARDILDETLRREMPKSARNLLLDERMRAAASPDELARFLHRDPVLLWDGYDESAENPVCNGPDCFAAFYPDRKQTHSFLPQLSVSTAAMLNTRMPLDLLAHLAASPQVPRNLHVRLLFAALTRALLLQRWDIAARLAPLLADALPTALPYVESFLHSTTDDERRFAGAYLIAKFPAMRPYVDSTLPRYRSFDRIDSYRDNWWCRDTDREPEIVLNLGYEPSLVRLQEAAERNNPEYPAFLGPAEKDQVAKEAGALKAIGPSEQYIPRIVLKWSREHLRDPRVPEALHLAVRVSRYACTTYDFGRDRPKFPDYSRQAFQLLHRHFPESVWTKKTPFWFEN